jgi:hypothetical protein
MQKQEFLTETMRYSVQLEIFFLYSDRKLNHHGQVFGHGGLAATTLRIREPGLSGPCVESAAGSI